MPYHLRMILNIRIGVPRRAGPLPFIGFRTVAVFFLLMGIFETHFAYAGRPFSTEDAGVAGRGVVQFEQGNSFSMQSQSEELTVTSTPIVGLTDRFEVSSDFPVAFKWPDEEKGREGFSDINLILKSLLIHEGEINPALLLKSQIKFSNASKEKGFGSGDEDYLLAGVATKTLKGVTFHGNLGYTFVGDKVDESLRNYFLYGVAAEIPMTRRTKLMAEIYGEKGKHKDTDESRHERWNPLVGLTFQATDSVLLDIAWKIGLSKDEEPLYALLAGVSLTLPEWKGDEKE